MEIPHQNRDSPITENAEPNLEKNPMNNGSRFQTLAELDQNMETTDLVGVPQTQLALQGDHNFLQGTNKENVIPYTMTTRVETVAHIRDNSNNSV